MFVNPNHNSSVPLIRHKKIAQIWTFIYGFMNGNEKSHLSFTNEICPPSIFHIAKDLKLKSHCCWVFSVPAKTNEWINGNMLRWKPEPWNSYSVFYSLSSNLCVTVNGEHGRLISWSTRDLYQYTEVFFITRLGMLLRKHLQKMSAVSCVNVLLVYSCVP